MQFNQLKRREFITLLGGASAWPLAGNAQQSDRMRQVGVLMGTSESDPNQKALVSEFTRSLADLGWKEGANLRIERRWAEGELARLRAQAAELARIARRRPLRAGDTGDDRAAANGAHDAAGIRDDYRPG